MSNQRRTRRNRKLIILGISICCLAAAPFLMRSDQSAKPSSVKIEQTATDAYQSDKLDELTEQLLPAQGEHPLDPLLRLAETIRERLATGVRDYTATLVKQERVGGKLLAEERMQLKLRNPDQDQNGEAVPLSCYLKFLAPKSAAGREVIWVRGEHDNKLIIHEGGFKNLLRLKLAPDNILVMRNSKYPITEIGLLRLSEKLIEKGARDRRLGMCEVKVTPNQKIGDRPCHLIEIIHPEKQEGFDFHIAQIFIDQEYELPIRYAAYMWTKEADGEPLLEEEYTYLNLTLNVGLTNADFDPDNPAYNYP